MIERAALAAKDLARCLPKRESDSEGEGVPGGDHDVGARRKTVERPEVVQSARLQLPVGRADVDHDRIRAGAILPEQETVMTP
jgi:hypothetical protein